ncbi:hypothetical protein DH2020_023133 [Rehmannia glutinosa]|uniref:Uncharacterized protein n=1 Tax=Rehmannia glutinosa TaxID=99300 RepID=A0ABR0W9I9_REHGL
MKIPGLISSENNLLQAPPVGNVVSGVDDPNKKIRKPYTITKSRESWSEQEHEKFLEALHLRADLIVVSDFHTFRFDRDWKKIEAFVGSKTVIQDLWETLTHDSQPCSEIFSESPEEWKKRALLFSPEYHEIQTIFTLYLSPYAVASQATGPLPTSAARLERGYAVGLIRYDVGLASVTNNYSSSSNESTPRVGKSNEMYREVTQCNSTTRVTPDFAEVYRFIGSVFDPSASDHLQRLKKMDPINVETALMLMKNLSVNLVSPEFEDHRRLLTSCNVGIESDDMGCKIQSA